MRRWDHSHDGVSWCSRSSAVAVRQAWDRLIHHAGLTNLRFDDLRRKAVSLFFEVGQNVPEVALISDHWTPAMLFRYTQLRPELIVDEKLARVPEEVRNEIEIGSAGDVRLTPNSGPNPVQPLGVDPSR